MRLPTPKLVLFELHPRMLLKESHDPLGKSMGTLSGNGLGHLLISEVFGVLVRDLWGQRRLSPSILSSGSETSMFIDSSPHLVQVGIP